MVLCFLIHTVAPLPGLPPGGSRVLYCRVFGPDQGVQAGGGRSLSPEERRLLGRERSAVVARQVQSAVLLSREACGRPAAELVPGEEAAALQEAAGGVLRLRAGEPLPLELSALWLAVHSLGFTLLCEPHENLLLAEGTLRTLTRLCLDHLHLLGQGSEVLLKSNRIDVLLSRLLPQGQLLFLNHRLAQSLEREASACMAK